MFPDEGRAETTRQFFPHFLMAACVFALVFWYPWEHAVDDNGYLLYPDSYGYLSFDQWRDPWRVHRSIGYRLFLYPFAHGESKEYLTALREASKSGIDLWKDNAKNYYIMTERVGIAKKFERVALLQRLIMAFSFALFAVALSRWIPPLVSFVTLLIAFSLAPPPYPAAILTEPLCSALTALCGAFLLFAPKSVRQGACFAMACLCASLAFLIGPRSLSLVGFCSLLFFYVAWGKHSRRRLAKSALAFTPLLIAYGYIGWLSLTGGGLFLHTQWEVDYNFYYYFAEKEDAQYMPTERAKKYTEWYGNQRKIFFNKIKNGEDGFHQFDIDQHSPVKKRSGIGDILTYTGAWVNSMKHFRDEKDISKLNASGRAIFGKELKAGLWPRHTGEIFLSWWQNFLAGLCYYDDIYQLQFMGRASFPINLGAILLSLFSIMRYPSSRWPLIVMLGIPLMTIIAAAVGHFVIERYVTPTAAFLLIAGMSSLWMLCSRGYARLKNQGASTSGLVT